MDWGFDTLFALLGLLLVLEGLLPAISPEKWRCLLEKFLTFSDSGVRTMGVSSMGFRSYYNNPNTQLGFAIFD